jgi:predicted hydrocarbon binding protein
MIATTLDLPLRGNCFADEAYLAHDLGAGSICNRRGERLVGVSDEFLIAMMNTLESELGSESAAAVKGLGRDWGRHAAEQFAAELGQFYGKPLSELPLAQFTASLTAALQQQGWGALRLDLSGYPYGLVIVEMHTPILGAGVRQAEAPVDGILAAFLAGMFSQFAGVELECVQTDCRGCGADASRFVVTVPQRLAAIAEWAVRQPHDAIVRRLIEQGSE